MADEVKTDEVPGVVEPAVKELVVTEGVGVDVFSQGLSLPKLSKDMPLAERRTAVRDALKQVLAIPDRLSVLNGEYLFEIKENEYWKEYTFTDAATGETRAYASFDEYSEVEHGIKRRKAYYMIAIYKTFVRDLQIPTSILAGLEWSKAMELTDVLTTDNWKEILDKLPHMTVKEVKKMADEMKHPEKAKAAAEAAAAGGAEGAAEGGTGTVAASTEAGDEFKKLTFKLTADQYENVERALKTAEGMAGTDKPGHLIDMICTDYLSSALGSGVEGALAKLDVIIKSVERGFGVKLEIKDITDKARYEAIAKAEEEKAAKPAA